MMDLPAFAKGMCVGMVAGVMLDMVTAPRPQKRKTAVGKALQRVGNAMDQTISDVRHMMK